MKIILIVVASPWFQPTESQVLNLLIFVCSSDPLKLFGSWFKYDIRCEIYIGVMQVQSGLILSLTR